MHAIGPAEMAAPVEAVGVGEWDQLADTVCGAAGCGYLAQLVAGVVDVEGAADSVADEVRQGVEDAGAALDELTKRAEDAKKKRDAALIVPKLPEAPESGDAAVAEDIAKSVAESVGKGTFSAAIAGRMGMSNRGEQATIETADNTREMSRIFADINRKFDEGKLVVAE
jgi:hypothetical protein